MVAGSKPRPWPRAVWMNKRAPEPTEPPQARSAARRRMANRLHNYTLPRIASHDALPGRIRARDFGNSYALPGLSATVGDSPADVGRPLSEHGPSGRAT